MADFFCCRHILVRHADLGHMNRLQQLVNHLLDSQVADQLRGEPLEVLGGEVDMQWIGLGATGYPGMPFARLEPLLSFSCAAISFVASFSAIISACRSTSRSAIMSASFSSRRRSLLYLGGKGVNVYPPAPACLPPGTHSGV